MVDDQGGTVRSGSDDEIRAVAAHHEMMEFRAGGMLAPAPGARLPSAESGQAEGVPAGGTAYPPEPAGEARPWWSRIVDVNSTPIDRSVQLDPMFVDKVIDTGDGTSRIIRRPVGYPSGGLPPDPAILGPVDRDALCSRVAPRAAFWCRRGLG